MKGLTSPGTSVWPARSHRHPLRVGWLASAGTALALLLSPAVHRPQPRLLWNASASVPLGLYRIGPGEPPRIGDLAAVQPSPMLGRFMASRRYVEANALLLKPVAAASGAMVCRFGVRVTIDARTVAIALPHDRLGRALPAWSGCRRLGADQLFLIAPSHAASFDSRYFGPVERRSIVGRVRPLWVWS